MPTDTLQLRAAVAADLPALLALEAQFPGDRLSPRQFRHHLTSRSARLWVAEAGGSLVGASLVFFRAGSVGARLYSLVVDARARGRGIGALLLSDAEAAALSRGCVWMGLEVRADNMAAIALYRRSGYRLVGPLASYYSDGGDGLRFRRELS